jgi:hypothetical protein
MPAKQKIITLICFLGLILPAASMARAQTIAVFPVDDLSLGINSFNMEVTRYLADKITAKGLNVIQEQDIIAFMASKRIHWLGYLDTENIMQTKEALGADLVLFGTIKIEKQSSSYGLILNMVRTMDAKTIWTSSGGLSLVDMQRLLGLNQPATLGELWPILVNNVLASWPTDLNETLFKP